MARKGICSSGRGGGRGEEPRGVKWEKEGGGWGSRGDDGEEWRSGGEWISEVGNEI